jgi:quinol monooxygenase YgiN
LALSQAKEKMIMAQPQHTQPIDDLRAQVSRMLASLPPDTPIAATVVFQVEPSQEPTFLHNAQVLTAATRQLPGCQVFGFHRHKSLQPEPAQPRAVEYLIFEEWTSRVLFQVQWDSAHLKHFQYTVGELVVAPPDLNFYYGAEAIAEARVAQTGQTHCWDTNGALIPCTGTGQDAEIQAGAPWPTPRFTDNGDGTVTDHLTGLIWLKDADYFGEVTWEQALVHARNLASGSAGLSDGSQRGQWRLPNIRELFSLIDYGSAAPILPAGHPFTGVKSAIYWTSTTLTAVPTLAWMMTLGIGPTVFVLKHNTNRMWPVRGQGRVPQTGQTHCWDSNGASIPATGTGQDGDIRAGVPWPMPRFLDNGDGTVLDKLTGLIWLKNANPFGFRTWDQALTDCNSLASGSYGLTDGSTPGMWRLPNIKEIESLVDYGRVGPCLPDGHPFVDVRPSSYWTSTSVAAAPTEAMFIIFGVGPAIFENKEHPFFVWPVRGPVR